ncbi:unnamed protein product [Cylindrotheca closterium]|uniref:Uncharacterized protein n=1 Tax=Cylindrotheca closterium TaxID=2856 RepID=A0AAD2GDJ6_9STRA|nr:unnamed protein product [Cylindrotheca closterium]
MSSIKDQQVETHQVILSEESIPRAGSGGINNSQVMERVRMVAEVTMWSTHCSTLLVHDGVCGLSVILYQSCIVFGRDCFDCWCFLCHDQDYDDRVTYLQWREQGRMDAALSWKSLLVDGPIKLGLRVYPTIVDFGKDTLIPTTVQLLRLVGELFILLCQLLFGIIITLTPWACALLWPERRHKSSARQEKKREIAAFGGGAGPRPCDVGHSFGYHIDISDIDANGYPLRHDDDMTAVSEITNDEAIRSPAGMVRALRSVSVPDNVLLLFPLKSGSRKKKLELQTPTISSAGPSTQENTPKDCTPTVKLFQRRSMETIRSKWKKSTPELKANVVAVSTKLRRSLLKQNIV